MQTPIRWAGSKKGMLPTLRKHWRSESQLYIEPFCGSACFFFDIKPSKAILSDINWELITTYKAIKKNPEKVIRILKSQPLTKKAFYKTRKTDPKTLDEHEVASRFLFLNKLCFNGIYRTNNDGRFNVPYGKQKSRVKFDFELIREASRRLKKASILNSDFELILNDTKKGDFVYLDPPYAIARRRVFSEYHPDSFSEVDLKRLRRCLKDMDERGVHFVVSYGDSKEGRKLAAGWHSQRIPIRRHIAGFVDSRRIAYEIMASNMELKA
jgi:DNA adenine methylase